MSSPLIINVHLSGYSRLDFDRRPIRKVIAQESRAVRAEARRLVSRRAISQPGEYPGIASGDLRRSITAKTKAKGFVGVVSSKRTVRMAERKFYPAILITGVEGVIAPRADPVAAALESRREAIQSALSAALEQSIIPRQ